MKNLYLEYSIPAALFLVFAFLIIKAGFLAFLKRIVLDCLVDHSTGKITINNLARFTCLFAFIFVYVATHFNISFDPFLISAVPHSEVELGLILAFIAAAEYVKKEKAASITQRINVESENTNINPNG